MNSAKTSSVVSHTVEELFYEDKTFRDPVHGDIMVNHLEVPVIDTERFQRLRRLRQLGTAHFVYHGAEHSRFQHSLGTLHMAQVLLRNVKENRFSKYTMFGDKIQDQFFVMIVRLAALIHDLDEFPLSHVLEKEGSVFRKQWEDDATNAMLLGSQSEIFRAIYPKVKEIIDNQIGGKMKGMTSKPPQSGQITFAPSSTSEIESDLVAKNLAATILAYSYRLIRMSEEKTDAVALRLFGNSDVLIHGLFDERFLNAGNQIVLNTISADLLDYSKRDFYFCGIGKDYDQRFLKYATIVDNSSGPVFAYRLVSKRNEIKSSVLSSLFDVLELRYSLAENVHTHHTKNIFSAMAIEAFTFYYYSLSGQSRKELENHLMMMGDDEFLYFISEKCEATRHILSHYYQRRPYEEFTLLTTWDSSVESLETFRKPEQRMFLEKCIVEWFNKSRPPGELVDGDVLVYAMPPPEALYKELDSYVVYLDPSRTPRVEKMSEISKDRKPYRARDSASDTVINRVIKQREELIEKYTHLWRTNAYLSPDVAPELGQVIRPMVEQLFLSSHHSLKIPEAGQIPSDLYASLNRAQSQRSFQTFKELYEALTLL